MGAADIHARRHTHTHSSLPMPVACGLFGLALAAVETSLPLSPPLHVLCLLHSYTQIQSESHVSVPL